MTSNQIAFARLTEDKRHNIATENISRDTYSEGARHNLQAERQNWYTAEQNASIGWANVKVSRTNAISQSKNADAAWWNAQTNATNAQTNIINAKTMEDNMRINKQQADTAQKRMENDFEFGRLGIQNSWKEIDIAYQNMITQRTNVSNNYLLGLGNLAVNQQRANNDYTVGMANVAVGQQANVIRGQQVALDSTRLSNQMIQFWDSQKEVVRHNQAMEGVARGNLWSTEGLNASSTTRNYASVIIDAARAATPFLK